MFALVTRVMVICTYFILFKVIKIYFLYSLNRKIYFRISPPLPPSQTRHFLKKNLNYVKNVFLSTWSRTDACANVREGCNQQRLNFRSEGWYKLAKIWMFSNAVFLRGRKCIFQDG